MKQLVKAAARRVLGHDPAPYRDLSPETRETMERCRPFTMTSPERIASLCAAIEYVTKHDIPGDFVECGVWKGGSSMAAALTYQRTGRTPDLYLYDTYEGMSAPTEDDIDASTGATAEDLLNQASKDELVWCYSSLDEVKGNIGSTGYPMDRVHMIKGKVEDTIPGTIPEQIAILRLDTDFYESTRHELVHLYPRLSHGGVLIIDDYGHWLGARKAVDEYIEENGLRILLNRIDVTGRIAIKC